MKFLNLVLVTTVFLMVTACGRGPMGNTGAQGAAGPTGPAAPVPPPPVIDPIQQQIDSLVTEENAWRESQGQTMLSKGMSCTVQAISSGGFLSTSSPNYVAASCTANPLSAYCAVVTTGSSYPFLGSNFDQVNSNSGPNSIITDPYIQSLFTSNNYKINCSGQLVVLEDGYQGFSMSSDDGAILTVNGSQVINNDGNHGITTVSGVKLLRAGVYSISVLYAQSGAGQFALILNMNGAVLPAAQLYH